jgi:hypothetical protein
MYALQERTEPDILHTDNAHVYDTTPSPRIYTTIAYVPCVSPHIPPVPDRLVTLYGSTSRARTWPSVKLFPGDIRGKSTHVPRSPPAPGSGFITYQQSL